MAFSQWPGRSETHSRTSVPTISTISAWIDRYDSLYYYSYNALREIEMDTISYSHTRQRLAEVMDRVNDDHAPVLITRQNGRAVVMMSLDEYNALEETAYLLRSPKSAKRLMTSVEQLRSQGGKVRKLIPDAD